MTSPLDARDLRWPTVSEKERDASATARARLEAEPD